MQRRNGFFFELSRRTDARFSVAIDFRLRDTQEEEEQEEQEEEGRKPW